MARRLVGAGGTGVLAADSMSMRPAVVPRVRSLRRSPPSPRRHRWSSRATLHRIRQFLVGRGERADGGRESQIGRRLGRVRRQRRWQRRPLRFCPYQARA
jgi:hypothetical protein